MTFVDSWDQSDLESLEREADLRSFALDPAWQDAAVSSRYATPQMLGLREAGSLRAICVGLRRSRAGFSKVVCGTNGGVGILASEPNSATILMRHVWQKWRPSELQVFASYAIPDLGFSWEPSYTTHVDLTLPMEQIIGEFKKRTRKHIERALKEGVTATTAVGREIDDAIELIVRTSRSKHFPLPPREYLLSMHRSFAKSGLSELVVAKRADRILATVHVIGARGVASWWKGGATAEGYSSNASSVALVHAMRVAAERAFEIFDLGGTHPGDPKYAAIHQYKSSFGGKLVRMTVGSRSTIAAKAARRLALVSP